MMAMSGGGANAAKVCVSNTAPWGTVNNTSVSEGWGDGWTAYYKGYLVTGIAACLSQSGSNGTPPSWDYGAHCWCKMTGPVVGKSWVFNRTDPSGGVCYANCALHCANCVRSGTADSCTRTALLAV
jgi:hypothetical protein